MARRSLPQAQADDRAFPIRLKIAVPPDGLRGAGTRATIWLQENLAAGDYASHAAGGAAAFYFRTLDAAQRFLDAMPDLKLADGTQSAAYYSPARAAAQAAAAAKARGSLFDD